MAKSKVICSCIRNKQHFQNVDSNKLLDENKFPKAGDVFLAEVINDDGYEYLEDWNGRNVKLYKGDLLVGVLGNRYSGTNNYGKIPEYPVSKNQSIDLLAQGGICGECICAGDSSKTKKLQIVGFYSDIDGNIYNLNNHRVELNKLPKRVSEKLKIIIVFGTSAETGKTTLMSGVINCLKCKKKLVASLKLCGTGRLKDKLSYFDAGAEISLDFVDFGLPTTYGIQADNVYNIFQEVYNYSKNKFDYLLVEIGGDLLEANASTGVSIANEMDCVKMVCVNDAMGGLMYKNIFEDALFFSYRQNIFALKERLGDVSVYDINEKNIKKILNELYEG